MLQRIQTVYLLIVAILMIVAMSLPVGNFIAADMSLTEFTNLALVSAEGVKDYTPWAMFAVLIITAIITLVTIFLYKKRMLQIRLTLFTSVMLIGYYVLLVLFIIKFKGEMSFAPSWSICIPIVCIVFNYLAIRGIGKDEMLVRAYDRLR